MDMALMVGHSKPVSWPKPLSSGLEIHRVPGNDSGSMLIEPHVRVLARQIETCIKCARLIAASAAPTEVISFSA